MAGAKSDVSEVLLRALDDGVTGALLGYTPTGERCTAYTMGGDLLAVQAADDDLALLRRLVNAGHLKARDAGAIEEEVEAGGSAAPLLFERVPEGIVSAALFERFRENLFRFLGGRGPLAFEPMDAVFVDNIQVGHDSRALIEELEEARAILARESLAPGTVLFAGSATVTTEEQIRLMALAEMGTTMAELLELSPYEAARTRMLVRTMLSEGTLEIRRPAPAKAPAAPDYVEDGGNWVTSPPSDGGGADLFPDADGDEHTEEVDRSGFSRSPPVSPVQLLHPSSEEDDLAAFADHDYSRGDGSFVQSRRSLDRVVLRDAPADDGELLVEMEEADPATVRAQRTVVSLNFTGRKLVDTDARRKIEVVNEVLATVVAAIEEEVGNGVGQARAQVLLEGTSGAHAVLFTQIELQPGGRLPVDRVLRNLKKRPEGERRHLLNRALADVIERALSLANEALDQRGMERMLEQIAGYQQRMGV